MYDQNTIIKNEEYNKVLRNKINVFKKHIEHAQNYFIGQDPLSEEYKKHLHMITGRSKRELTEITIILDLLIKHIKYLEKYKKKNITIVTINSNL